MASEGNTSAAQAEEYQAKADRHHDSVYLVLVLCALVVDLLGLIDLGSISTLLTAPIPWFINLYLWYTFRQDWDIKDYATGVITSIMESIPLLSALPSTTGNVIQKWILASERARENQANADKYNQKAGRT